MVAVLAAALSLLWPSSIEMPEDAVIIPRAFAVAASLSGEMAAFGSADGSVWVQRPDTSRPLILLPKRTDLGPVPGKTGYRRLQLERLILAGWREDGKAVNAFRVRTIELHCKSEPFPEVVHWLSSQLEQIGLDERVLKVLPNAWPDFDLSRLGVYSGDGKFRVGIRNRKPMNGREPAVRDIVLISTLDSSSKYVGTVRADSMFAEVQLFGASILVKEPGRAQVIRPAEVREVIFPQNWLVAGLSTDERYLYCVRFSDHWKSAALESAAGLLRNLTGWVPVENSVKWLSEGAANARRMDLFAIDLSSRRVGRLLELPTNIRRFGEMRSVQSVRMAGASGSGIIYLTTELLKSDSHFLTADVVVWQLPPQAVPQWEILENYGLEMRSSSREALNWN